ncbi:polysaccharide biosynthesis/export family protein [Moraxella caviae]|nr:polysaccharide biosynthesis/export family protein [Moraxella caviae]
MKLKSFSLLAASVAFVMSAQATTNSYSSNFGSSNNAGRLALMGDGVPAEATQAEAVAAASLNSNAVIDVTRPYQAVQTQPKIFGEQLFRGAFSTTSGSTFNDSYVINEGDNVQVRMWGAYQYAATMTVDPQGNIFLPNVGPVRVAGVQNGNLQNVVQSAIARIYRSNVGVYASLENAQPVKVFVTGFVNQPGYYGGLAADSVLSYLDRAGGVDPERGSYIDVQVRRNGQLVQQINLYDFLIMGRLSPFSFRDGDVITVAPQKQTFDIAGRVQNPYKFEFNVHDLTVADVLSVANPLADATNISITRASGREQTAEYYSLSEARSMPVRNGDKLVVTSDRYAGSIAVQVTGAHRGNGAVILPYGARLKDVVAQLEPSSLANIKNLTIYRESVKAQQKESINRALDRLEEMTLTTQSTTREEAQLRTEDAKLVEQFIAKARNIEPSGRVVVVPNSWQDIILQQGDIIHIPETTSVITVNGQVRTQGALSFDADLTVGDYIVKSGGFDDNANTEEILVMHQNGETITVNTAYRVQQGDEIMVLPKVKTRRVEIARGIAQVIYQLAVATGVIVRL